ncbi:Zn(II)2Cys6 transcription factor [Aspergillus foveolatus]|uniref:Zn(II)2Cys6 transcription factor n=1 Tax=Aspergillus foveolatus TaxID=210207 RepID=UPI003CCCC655
MPPDRFTPQQSACDFCHGRKIKCNRQAPCDNCIDALVECRRDRPRRSRRPKGSRVSSLNKRILALERAAATLPGDLSPPASGSPIRETLAPAASGAESIVAASNGARQLNIPASFRPDSTAAKDSVTQQTSEGSKLLRRELEWNGMIGQDRSVVLKRAIDFVSRISNSEVPSYMTGTFQPSTIDDGVEPHKFPPELLYMMTMNPEPETGFMKRSFWPAHISPATLENMCLSIMEEKVDRHTLVCYRICVYMTAATMISRLPRRDQSVLVRRHLEKSKKQYENEIQRALGELDFLAPPTLAFLQALLSGALFIQNQGDMSRSWTLTAFASRTLVSLNYHTIDKYISSDRSMQDIYGTLYLCYYLDKILSVLLLRPPSLPKLKIKPADLVCLESQFPLSACVKVMVCLGQIQEGVLDILFNHTEKDYQVIAVNALVREMYRVRTLMDEPQCQALARETHFEWLAIEFGYYAVLASVLHLLQRVVRSPLSQQECLYAARQSLVQLTKLQDEISIHKNVLDEYPYFLTWTLLFFPLNPFFVVFCNVIYTRNSEDYTLLSNATSVISCFSNQSRSVAELHKLFAAFLGLCDPLFHEFHAPELGTTPQSLGTRPTTTLIQPDSTLGTEDLLDENLTLSRYGLSVGSDLPQAGDDVAQDQAVFYGEPGEGGPSDNELTWDLLQSQPWLGWMRSDA